MSPTGSSHDLRHQDVGMAWPLTASSGYVECGMGPQGRISGEGAVQSWGTLLWGTSH